MGDWYSDGKTWHAVLLKVVDRLSRLTLIKKIAHKEADDVNQGLIDLLGSIPKEFVHSLTPDHGREFLSLDEIQERLGVTIYWPDPYSPEQRGTNENTNGLIREYFPKRTDIDNYTEEDVEFCQDQLNRRPRKILNYETPSEVFFEEPLHLVWQFIGNLEVTLVILIFGALVYSGGYVAWKKEWVDWPGILCEPLYNLKMKRKFPELKREADQAYEAKIAQLQQSFDAETEELADIWDQERQTELQWKIKTGEKLTTVLEDINHSIDQQETTLATTQKITETTAKNLENVRQQRPAGFPVPHGRELDLQFYLHLHEILVTEQETAIGPAIKLAETRFENRENTMALGQLIENFRQTFIEELHNQNQLMEDLNDRIVSRLDKQIDLLDNLTGTVSRGMSDVTSGLKRMDDHLEKVNTTIADTNQLIKQSNEEIANDLNSLVDYANRREQRLTRR